jgi:hypothetical protein
MKNFKLFAAAMAFVALFVFSSSTANAQSENSYVGKATAELSQCLAEAHSNGLEVSSSVNVIGTCPDGSELVEVTFIGRPHCQPHEPCPFFAVFLGSVQFDCDGNIVSSQCGATPQ